MTEHRIFLDAFADARRTWDDLVSLQPDILAASSQLDTSDLDEIERRVAAHRDALEVLAESLTPKAVERTRMKSASAATSAAGDP